MKIYKITELTETKNGQTYAETKVFSTREKAKKYFINRKIEIPMELKPDGVQYDEDDMVEMEKCNGVVVFWYGDNYVTIYDVEEDELD